ncbi:tetratricopeptide repeat protein [Pedobacter gandavensis]|uniref:Tetratricopeptide repeat protein n=1 Tax=Pedobacter gandavensis TaxID=2679963 RepID=A0ABR6EX35_9SPHI|nr:tetratricopeptide repeat protein [Pedobacter gandavensis]MBB2149852.1 tetratricopeptide repeat protein [Pedobacter gandavensis]
MKQRSLLLSLLLAGLSAAAQQPGNPKLDSTEVKTLFFAGLREKLNENYSKAGESFQKILTIDPKNAAVYYEIASLNYRQNKLAEAEAAIKKSVALDANNLWYWKMMAELYKRKGDMEGLVGVFNELIRLSPEDDAFYFDRGNAYLLLGKTTEALQAYDELEKKFGVSKALIQARQRIDLGNKKSATKADMAEMLTAGPDDVPGMLDLSQSMVEKGQMENALVLLKKAKNISPENYEIDLALADYYQNLKMNNESGLALRAAFNNPEMPTQRKGKIILMIAGTAKNSLRLEEAIALCKLAMESSAKEPNMLALNGDLLYQKGDLKGALQQYQEVLILSDQLYPVWERVLTIQNNLGKYKEAAKTGEEALAIFPNQAILYYYQAFALHRDQQNVAAMINVKSAMQLDGDNPELQALIFALQGEIFLDERKFKEANTAFDKAVTLAPKNYLLLNNYAFYLALSNQDLEKAAGLAAKAAAALPGNTSVADTYALILFKLGKYDKAKTWAELAIQHDGAGNGLYLEHYGDILFFNGEQEAAVLHWQKAKDAGNEAANLKRKINEKKYIK